jgi:hypothetical protein
LNKIIGLIFSLFLWVTTTQAHLKSTTTHADNYAWSTSLDSSQEAMWPYEIKSIGHSMQSYQNYSTSPYWHDGLDMRGEAHQEIFSATAGIVVNIENYYPGNKYYWEVAILDDSGFVWKYHHVEEKSITSLMKNSYKYGNRINKGDSIGKIIPWGQSAYGEQFHHIHLLIVDGTGKYINPFKLLPRLADTTFPIITKIGLFDKRRKIISGNQVSGKHGVYIDASDTVLHDKFLLTPYFISYRLNHSLEKVVWQFDHLPSVTNDEDYILDFYLKGSCGNYHCRKFYINLNFNKNFPDATEFFQLEEGEHEIEVKVMDFAGNATTKIFSYKVVN